MLLEQLYLACPLPLGARGNKTFKERLPRPQANVSSPALAAPYDTRWNAGWVLYSTGKRLMQEK